MKVTSTRLNRALLLLTTILFSPTLAMAQTPNVMPSLHMPLQSGSDKVLRDMRRSYRSAKFLRILDSVRAHIPEAAITTDIIVGFPGETEEDFQGTLDVVRQAVREELAPFTTKTRALFDSGSAGMTKKPSLSAA